MIVDVHTHTPRYRTAEDAGEDKGNAMWRPDQVQPSRPDWNLYLEAMKPVDNSISGAGFVAMRARTRRAAPRRMRAGSCHGKCGG